MSSSYSRNESPLIKGTNDSENFVFVNQSNITTNKANESIYANKIIVGKEKAKRTFFCFKKKFDCNNHTLYEFNNNQIATSKYTVFNVLPKILFEQFSKMANVYFLIMAILQTFKEISTSGGKPVILLPLLIVVSINGVKDFLEDYKRKVSDEEENNKDILIYNFETQNFEWKKWKDVKLGDVIKVNENEYFPSDCIILCSSSKNQISYIETRNIDGETSLKTKKSNPQVLGFFSSRKEADLNAYKNFEIHCAYPNENIYEFCCKFVPSIPNGNDNVIYLDINNFLLRGSCLKQTNFVYCAVVYVGHHTKIMMNSVKSLKKVSKIEYIMNHQIIIVFCMQIIIGVFCGFLGVFSEYINSRKLIYLYMDDEFSLREVLIRAGTWIVLINSMVPISLLVTMEMIKYIQGFFISWDIQLYDTRNHQQAKVQTSTLNEELGQVKYIFSDKTGTLTQNYMQFRAVTINGKLYGLDNYIKKNITKDESNSKMILSDDFGDITNFNFKSTQFDFDLQDTENYQSFIINKFLDCLALCHSIESEEQIFPKIKYKSSSPDETALINFARYYNKIFKQKDISDHITITNKQGVEKHCTLIYAIDYTSERKCMSVIVRDANKKIYIFTKGADNIVSQKLKPEQQELLKVTSEHLLHFAKNGLRTLMMAYKELSENEVKLFLESVNNAKNSPINKTKLLSEIYAKMENNLELLGATGIEDQLQDDVSDVLSSFISAGIKVWMLTGDKKDTAKSIAFSCKLVDHSFYIFELSDAGENISKHTIRQKLNEHSQQLIKNSTEKPSTKHALIVTSAVIQQILADEELKTLFYFLSVRCNSVICCRVSPKQKAELVNLLKLRQENVTTLSIGDGANDVNMITAANIGIGILGVEGLQAARSADYCISQFKYLKRLLFVHGRESYRKNSFAICYIFYKNFLFIFPHFWFGFRSYFSGQFLYDPWMIQLFNTVFTSFPIIWFGIYDKEFSYDYLMRDHRYYTQGIVNKLFHTHRFWKWIIYGVLQGLLLYVYCFNSAMLTQTGNYLDLSCDGSIIYSGVVLIVTVKIFLTTSTHSYVSLFLFVFSIFSYFFSLYIMSFFTGLFTFNNFYLIYDFKSFYLSQFFLLVFCVLIDRAIDKYCRIYGIIEDPLKINAKQYDQLTEQKELDDFKNSLKFEELNNQYKGNAFSYNDESEN